MDPEVNTNSTENLQQQAMTQNQPTIPSPPSPPTPSLSPQQSSTPTIALVNTDVNTGKSNKNKTIIIMIVLFLLVLIVGISSYAIVFNSNKSQISSSDLVQENDSGISFLRPSQWQKIDVVTPGIDTAYTDGGGTLENSDQGMLISSNDLGVNYNELQDSQKSQLFTTFKNQYSESKSLENGSCQEVSSVIVTESPQTNFNTSYNVTATCDKFTGRDLKATIKMLIGIKDDKIKLVGIIAKDKVWDKSGPALDEILKSVTSSN